MCKTIDPGCGLLTDFTCMNELEITIQGHRFDQREVVPQRTVLTGIGNGRRLARSESFSAPRHLVQATLAFEGMRRKNTGPINTAATHEVRSQGEAGRTFLLSYLDLTAHFGLKRCISKGETR